MKILSRVLVSVAVLAWTGIAFAQVRQPEGVPTLGQLGLAALAIALVGGGTVLIRRRKS